ncbi:FkbM family methyltransferase [Pseudodonghicola flavimaris]|uniref:FkbM family methyltransferase n=1 Tax=Pseudodonghicola flavimaris TaxID=3050036 RepID=A0ABT7EV80_9RHOB|nr:FkbM family methyltransferase [Pseudodonghicola flavimaris]MDK3016253.1 FkbM family methyltransferase [Pseudodonghicola flavimaris]
MDAPRTTDPAATEAADSKPKFIRSRGLRFPYDTRIINRKRRALLHSDTYELKESEAVLSQIRPDDRVIELGAGMGYMSTLMARHLKVRDIHAFEANPAMIPYIRAVHAFNGVDTVRVHNALLGETAGEVTFYVRGDFVASSMADNLGDKHGGVIARETVPVRPVAEAFTEIRPTALVCDIEGAEQHLIPLMDLSMLRVAILELHPQVFGQDGTRRVFDAMAAAGLTYFPRASQGKVVTFRRGW